MDHSKLAGLAPAKIDTWLVQSGWQLVEASDRWNRYSRKFFDVRVTVEVPQRAGAIDYDRSVWILLADLARLYDTDPETILQRISPAQTASPEA